MPVANSRITQNMMNTQLVRNLYTNLNNMDRLQNQLATGRKINKPSDDPVGISFAMRYRSDLTANEQYQQNVSSSISWLEYTDSMLGQANSVFQRVRELSVQGANGSNPQLAADAIRAEIVQLKEQLVKIGNSEFNGKYVFNGQITDKAPYSELSGAKNYDDGTGNSDQGLTDQGLIQFEIGVGIKIPVNTTGNNIFGQPDDPDNAFKVLDDIAGYLAAGDFASVSNSLGRLDTRINKFLETRSDIGAKLNRIELADERLKDIDLNLQTLQSSTEDADLAEVVTDLKVKENVYQASLSVGAKIIQPSLVDFLR